MAFGGDVLCRILYCFFVVNYFNANLRGLGKRDLIFFLLSITRKNVVSVWRVFLFLLVHMKGCVTSLWFSDGLTYNYFILERYITKTQICEHIENGTFLCEIFNSKCLKRRPI